MAAHQLNISLKLSAGEETVLGEHFECQPAQLGARLAPYCAAAGCGQPGLAHVDKGSARLSTPVERRRRRSCRPHHG
jgi:hypothetical protein